MNVNLTEKQILVTGGTSVLGRVFVERAIEEGATVFFTYHQNSEEAGRLKALGAKCFRIDLARRSEIDQLKQQIQTETRTLDSIVCNAAAVRDHTIQNLSEHEWDHVLAVDLDSVYYLTKRFLSFLFKKPGSKILNVVSRAGTQGSFGAANYAAAKGGLIAFTKSLAREIGKKQILVNGLNPGFMKSPMTENIPEAAFNRQVDESVLKTRSSPNAVADFMIYLLSDRFRGVSGQIFHFDSRGTSA